MSKPIKRCRLHGPYSPEHAALLMLGKIKPPETSYLCPDCTRMIKRLAQDLADSIDKQAIDKLYKL